MAQRNKLIRKVVQHPLRDVDPKKWAFAQKVAVLLRPTLDGALTRKHAARIAKQLGKGVSTLYQYRRRLREAGLTSAVLPRSVGYPIGTTRLPPKQESILTAVIDRVLRQAKRVRVIDVAQEVARRCRAARLASPDRRSIDRQLDRYAGHLVMRRSGKEALVTIPTPGQYQVRQPLDVVQIDHTKIDVLVVDDLYRRPIGRPYVSLAMDVASRSVLAMLLTFEAPSAATVAFILTRVVSGKANWINNLQLEKVHWPMSGLPRSLHLDNAAEFHSEALARGCSEFGIELVYRPPGRPHFGGHIERLIGSFASRVKTLPGATGASVKGRKARKPEKTASLTLGELERWLVIDIAKRYHHSAHRGLKGSTPFGAWQTMAPLSRPVKDLRAFNVAFLPAEHRSVQRDGIHFKHIVYWHPALAQWIGRGVEVLVHYDPADISKLHVRLPNNSMIEVTYARLQRPAVSVWECKAAIAYLRQKSKAAVREDSLFAAIEAQRQIVAGARHATRKAQQAVRRESARKQRRMPTPPPAPASKVDYSVEPEAFPVEVFPPAR